MLLLQIPHELGEALQDGPEHLIDRPAHQFGIGAVIGPSGGCDCSRAGFPQFSHQDFDPLALRVDARGPAVHDPAEEIEGLEQGDIRKAGEGLYGWSDIGWPSCLFQLQREEAIELGIGVVADLAGQDHRPVLQAQELGPLGKLHERAPLRLPNAT